MDRLDYAASDVASVINVAAGPRIYGHAEGRVTTVVVDGGVFGHPSQSLLLFAGVVNGNVRRAERSGSRNVRGHAVSDFPEFSYCVGPAFVTPPCNNNYSFPVANSIIDVNFIKTTHVSNA